MAGQPVEVRPGPSLPPRRPLQARRGDSFAGRRRGRPARRSGAHGARGRPRVTVYQRGVPPATPARGSWQRANTFLAKRVLCEEQQKMNLARALYWKKTRLGLLRCGAASAMISSAANARTQPRPLLPCSRRAHLLFFAKTQKTGRVGGRGDGSVGRDGGRVWPRLHVLAVKKGAAAPAPSVDLVGQGRGGHRRLPLSRWSWAPRIPPWPATLKIDGDK